ncbi:hypothetical protein [Clavibacter capsici]|uniref:hypothetical protein n=1 Tax=Clavibacter capsici TaxID=1874630 RepID=UPI00293ECF49|nr:hypothetical protein [Clavibacter capsici]
MIASNVLRTVVIIAAAVGGVAFWLAGESGLGTLLLLAALAATFLMGPAILGDPAGMGRLPQGVTAADIKEHRKQHGGSISDAVRAVGQREG